jgi:hypothetical protein
MYSCILNLHRCSSIYTAKFADMMCTCEFRGELPQEVGATLEHQFKRRPKKSIVGCKVGVIDLRVRQIPCIVSLVANINGPSAALVFQAILLLQSLCISAGPRAELLILASKAWLALHTLKRRWPPLILRGMGLASSTTMFSHARALSTLIDCYPWFARTSVN